MGVGNQRLVLARFALGKPEVRGSMCRGSFNETLGAAVFVPAPPPGPPQLGPSS